MITNQSFYDLNGKRGYCVDGASDFPVDVIMDLKLAVPGSGGALIDGIFIAGNAIRLTFTFNGRVAAVFTSDSRATVRVGEPYALKSIDSACGGVVVLGPSVVQKDWNVSQAYQISEECLTRYEPSGITSIGVTCDSVRLTGEVSLGSGDTERLISSGVDLPHMGDDFPINTHALRLGLVDNGSVDLSNPQISMSNGTNSYFGMEGRPSPVVKLFNATADTSGRIKVLFDSHFNFRRVMGSGSGPSVSSQLALGTNITAEDFCSPPTSDVTPEPGSECPLSGIEFQVIDEP